MAEIGFGFACSGALITLLPVVGDASGVKLKPRVPGFAFASPGPTSEEYAAFGAAPNRDGSNDGGHGNGPDGRRGQGLRVGDGAAP